MKGVFLGDKKAYKQGSLKFRELFPEPTEAEIKAAERATPPKERWWCAKARPATKTEKDKPCKQCNRLLSSAKVKQCPNCSGCHHRCYFR